MNRPQDPELRLIDFDHRDSAETWRTNSISSDDVNRRLNRLWQHLEAPRPRRLGGVPNPDEPTAAPGMYARTNTFNLLICARTVSRAAQSAEVLGAMTSHFPTRAVALYSDPMLDRRTVTEIPDGGPISVRVALPRADSPSSRREHFESVAIIGGPRAIGSAASTVFPLCVPDLPTVLWWNGDIQYDLGVFRDLVGGSDQIVLDSSLFGDVDRSLVDLAPISNGLDDRASSFTDLAWLRTEIWRGLMAQFFDSPPSPDSIHSITEVSVTYDPDGDGSGAPSGHSAALLFIGWLMSRLGWSATEQPTRTPEGLRFVFRGRFSPTPIVVMLSPRNGDATATGLRHVGIVTGGSTMGRYTIEHVDRSQLLTRSEVEGMPPLSRHVMMPGVGEPALLDEAIRVSGRDDVAQAALNGAAQIVAQQRAGHRSIQTLEG